MAYTGRISHYFITSVLLCPFLFEENYYFGIGVGRFTVSSVLDWN